MEKENKRLRQQAEIRDSKLDDSNQRISALEKENRTMGKEMIFFRDSCTRVKDLERENKELVKQSSIDKKTLITLREVSRAITVSDICRYCFMSQTSASYSGGERIKNNSSYDSLILC